MIFSGSSKIKEVFYGNARIKEIYSGADLVWKRLTDTVKFANYDALNFSKAAPAGFKQYQYTNSLRADKAGFYDFHTTGPSGLFFLADGREEFVTIPIKYGGARVRIFLRDTDSISFQFNEKNIPITITAKHSTVQDSRRTVTLDYSVPNMIEDDGAGTASPSWTNRGVDLTAGRYWLKSNNGLYLNGNWVGDPGGWVDVQPTVAANIRLYYRGTRVHLVPGQTL
ncbi:hypothetical protein Q5532_10075 [Corynebacterium diphtheriae]|uniref:hypothetical protein n=1 Tax=Corynebacterium diphtheriae TaxID=1717 RepID=UPI00403D8C21